MIIDFCFLIFVILLYFAGNDGLWDDNDKINDIMIFVLLSYLTLQGMMGGGMILIKSMTILIFLSLSLFLLCRG